MQITKLICLIALEKHVIRLFGSLIDFWSFKIIAFVLYFAYSIEDYDKLNLLF